MLINFINVAMVWIIKEKGNSKYTQRVRGICLDLLRSGSHSDMWARWSREVVFNTTPTRM